MADPIPVAAPVPAPAAPAAAPAPVAPVAAATPAAPAPPPQKSATGQVTGVQRRPNIVTNPVAPVDPDTPLVEAPFNEDHLPASTRAEMKAGRDALAQTNKR